MPLRRFMRRHGTATIWSHDRDLRKLTGITAILTAILTAVYRFIGRDWLSPPSGPTLGSGTRR